MAKYIDANLLIWKIKRQIRMEELNFAALGGGGQTFCINTLEWVLKQIDSLPDEQPSKDLETEIATWIQSHLEIKNKQFEIYREPMTKWAEAIARHFAKWGAEHQVIDGNKMIEPSKDLEEAEFEYAQSLDGIPANQEEEKMIYDAFIAGANWQAEHAKDYPMPEDTVLFQKGVEEGKRLMIEDAVEGRIIETFNPATEEGKPDLRGITLIYEDKNKPYLTVGDIFKFAIIEKEDEQ